MIVYASSCFKPLLVRRPFLGTLLSMLLTLSLAQAREIGAEAAAVYKTRLEEYFKVQQAWPMYMADWEATQKFPFSFGDFSAEEKSQGQAKVAIELSQELLREWGEKNKIDATKLQCSSIDLQLELHTCPNCYVDREKKIKAAAKGDVIFATEGISAKDPESLEMLAYLATFPLLGHYSAEEMQFPLFGIESKETTTLSTFIDMEAKLSTFMKEKGANYLLGLKIDMYANPYMLAAEADLAGDMLGLVGNLGSNDLEYYDDIMRAAENKGVSPELLNLVKKYKADLATKDFEKLADFRWVVEEYVPKHTGNFLLGDLNKLVEASFNTFLKKALAEGLSKTGIDAAEVAKIFNLVEAARATKDYKAAHEFAIMVLRNIVFTQNILKLCESDSARGKKLVVQMGLDHGPGVAYLLQQSAPKLSVKTVNDAEKYFKLSREDYEAYLIENVQDLKANH